jgi:hypothetical protein
MTMPNPSLHRYICCIGFLFFSTPIWADQVINGDLIVTGDPSGGGLCVGAECMDMEFFVDPMNPRPPSFDTIRVKSGDPQIHFLDTSSSASFPTNDWRMGITHDIGTGSASFFITDSESGLDVLILQAADTGGVALGAGSLVVPGAISVGAPGTERPIVNVAGGTNDTDAVNMQQFADFETNINTNTTADAMAIQANVAAAQMRMDDLNLRIDDLLDRVEAMQNPTP